MASLHDAQPQQSVEKRPAIKTLSRAPLRPTRRSTQQCSYFFVLFRSFAMDKMSIFGEPWFCQNSRECGRIRSVWVGLWSFVVSSFVDRGLSSEKFATPPVSCYIGHSVYTVHSTASHTVHHNTAPCVSVKGHATPQHHTGARKHMSKNTRHSEIPQTPEIAKVMKKQQHNTKHKRSHEVNSE